MCLYAGSLVPAEVLAHCPPGARLIDTADLTLDEIIAAMAAADADGHDVVRLCSGDPAVFSAIAEQARRLDQAGIGYDITPGVPAFAAAAAALRRELTVPGVGQTVILSRIAHRATPMPPGEDLASLGATGATLVLHLAVQRIEQVVAELTPHYGRDCPAAVVAYASQDNEILLRGSLGDIAAQVLAAGVTQDRGDHRRPGAGGGGVPRQPPVLRRPGAGRAGVTRRRLVSARRPAGRGGAGRCP